MTARRILATIAIIICFYQQCDAQDRNAIPNTEKSIYLPEAPFMGYNYEPKLIFIRSFYHKRGVSEKDFAHLNLYEVTEDERYDILRGEMYCSKLFCFDKNGFATLFEIRRTKNKKKQETFVLKIERDEHSLATKRIYIRNGKRMEYVLNKRENGIETYQLASDERKQHHLTIKYEGDTVRHIEIDPQKRETVTIIVYNKQGLIKDLIIHEYKKDIHHYSYSYSYGYMSQTSYEKSSAADRKSPKIKDWKYMMYEGTDSKDYGTLRTWTRRDKYEGANATYSNSTPMGFDEMTVVYHE